MGLSSKVLRSTASWSTHVEPSANVTGTIPIVTSTTGVWVASACRTILILPNALKESTGVTLTSPCGGMLTLAVAVCQRTGKVESVHDDGAAMRQPYSMDVTVLSV